VHNHYGTEKVYGMEQIAYTFFVGNRNEVEYIYRDIYELPNVKFVEKSNLFKSRIFSVLFRFHFSQVLNAKWAFPLKGVWYRAILKRAFHDDLATQVFVFYPGWYDKLMQRWFHTVAPEIIRIVYFRDTINCYFKAIPSMKFIDLSKEFDYVLCYNLQDVEEYGFQYAPAYFSKIPQEMLKKEMPYVSVSFIGLAKDRLAIIRSIKARLDKIGVTNRFIVVGVPKEERKEDGIEYIDKSIGYLDYLSIMNSSDCILEVVKGDTKASTLRCWEAVYYNKKLLTNWAGIEEFKYYSSLWMQKYRDENDINIDFFIRNTDVEYHYALDNSPLRLLEHIDRMVATKVVDENKHESL